MSLISTRCLFVLVLILLPFPTRSDGTDGFPKLDNNKTVKAAVEKLREEDLMDQNGGFAVEDVMSCFAENPDQCFGSKLVRNEVRLRNGYKLLGEGCSADPALNQHLFSPPSFIDFVKYPIWQRHLLDANQPLCNPFKHLRCSKTTAKCECRSGLIWRGGGSKIIDLHDVRALRDREKICIFDLNKPCQMREYPGDEEIDSKALRPEEIKEGIPLAEYFPIFKRWEMNGERFMVYRLESNQIGFIQGLKIQSPACADNACSVSLYGQRQRVCAPRNWDVETIPPIETGFPPRLYSTTDRHPLKLGDNCNYEQHRRLFTISDQELSDSDFWAKRKKTLQAVRNINGRKYCAWRRLNTCSPPKLGEKEGKCECIPPSIPGTSPTASCVLPQEFNKCDMTNGLIKLLRNETNTRGTKLLLNKGVENAMLGVCAANFKCHAGLDISDEMEIYCTCVNGKAGLQCLGNLTGFLMFPRVPSFPSDVDDIQEKWKIFNELNDKAIQFEKIFKLSKGKSCDLNAEAEASTAVERIRRLDKKGTVMTKAQYTKLTDTIVKLTQQHQNGPGFCRRFDFPLTCNSVNKTCVTENQNILIEACKYLADSCELEGMFVVSGKCYCDPKPEPSKLGPNISAKSRGVVQTPHHYFIVLGVIIIAMK